MLKGFKEFISRGNVVELAVGVIIGAAFKNIVDALVDGIINPLIAAVIGKPDFSDAFILTLNGSDVKFGLLITAIINFILMAFAIYFCIVVPMNALNARRQKAADEAPEPEVSDEVSSSRRSATPSPRARRATEHLIPPCEGRGADAIASAPPFCINSAPAAPAPSHRRCAAAPHHAHFPSNLAHNSTRSLLITPRKRCNCNDVISIPEIVCEELRARLVGTT